jgi:gas vesicle protein
MRKSGPSNFVVGLGIGSGAGILAGMLLAPKSGRETRQVIRNSASKGEECLEQRAAKFRDTLNALNRHRGRFTAAIQAGRQAYREAAGGIPAVESPISWPPPQKPCDAPPAD